MRHGSKGNSRWQKLPATGSVTSRQSFPNTPAVAAEGEIGKQGGRYFYSVQCFQRRALPGEPGLAELSMLRQPGLREE